MAENWWDDAEHRFSVERAAQAEPMSAKGRDYAIRTVLAEAADQGPIGMAAVGHVIYNRVKHGGFGEGLEGVITKPYAFEPWLHAGKGSKNDPLRYSADSPQYQTAAKIVDAVFSGQIPDPTRGATHFYSPAGQAQLASIDNRKLVPDWATDSAHRASIGGHEFFAPEGAGGGGKIITVSRQTPKEATSYQMPDYLREAEEAAGGHLISPEFALPKQPQLKPIELQLPGGQSTAPQPTSPQPAAQPWGAGSSFLTGATSALTGGMGSLPKATATVRAGYEALTGQAPQGFGPRQRELAQEYQRQREAYQAEFPKTHMLSEMGGALAGSLAPMAAINRGVGLAGQAISRAAPAVRPAIEAASKFMAGQGGLTRPGISGGATRLASYGTQGAIQGGEQAALTQDLQPEGTTFGQNVLGGMLGGAAVGSVFNPLLGKLVAPLTAPITQPLRNMALAANQKFGLNIRPTQITSDAALKEFDERVVPEAVKAAQIKSFNDALAADVGLRGQELTRAAVSAAKDQFGQQLENIAQTTSMLPRRSFYQDLGDIRAEVYRTTLDDNPLRVKIDKLLTHIYNEVAPTGFLDGNKFRAITKRNGTIDKEFYNTDPALAHDIRDLMFDMFQVSDPTKASAYNLARSNYRKLNAIEPLTGDSGVVNPKGLLARVQRAKLSGDIKELAEAGQHISATTLQGGVKQGKGTDWWKVGAGVGGGAAGLAEVAPYLQRGAEALGINPAAPEFVFPAMVAGGLGYAAKKGTEAAMQSPLINQMVLRGNLPNFVTPMENLLARGGGELGAQVGAGKGR